MKNTLKLNKQIDELIRKISTGCKCNPCLCSEQTKEQYFLELKDILKRFNMEILTSSPFKDGIEINLPDNNKKRLF